MAKKMRDWTTRLYGHKSDGSLLENAVGTTSLEFFGKGPGNTFLQKKGFLGKFLSPVPALPTEARN
jgi:hypothetical protein